MTWNYRVCKEKFEDVTGELCYGYSVHEVYYNKKGEIVGISEEAIAPWTDVEFQDKDTDEEGLINLETILNRYRRALREPVIDLDTVEYSAYDEEDEEEDL